jgi:MFS family permease
VAGTAATAGSCLAAHRERAAVGDQRAFWLIVANGVLVRLYFEVFSPKRVVAAFLTQLTHREWMVGCALAIGPATACLPMLLCSHAMADRQQRMPFYRLGAQLKWISLALTLAFVAWLPGRPWLLAWLFIAMCGVFGLGDAVTGPAFGDIVARTVPSTRRGRLFGLRVAIGGTLAFFAGDLIRRVLSPDSRLGFPANYLLLFAVAFAFLVAAQHCFMRVAEPPLPHPPEARPPLGQYLREAGAVLRGDANALRYSIYRNLSPLGWVPAAFIIPYALDHLHFSAGVVGTLISTSVLASSVSNLVWGSLGDRYGNRLVIVMSSALLLVAAGMLALTPALASLGPGHTLLSWLVAVNALGEVGLTGAGNGQLNYMYDLAPDDQVPLYIGVVTTAAAPMTVIGPLLIGLAAHCYSYLTIFVLGVIFSVAVLAASLAIGEPRRS